MNFSRNLDHLYIEEHRKRLAFAGFFLNDLGCEGLLVQAGE